MLRIEKETASLINALISQHLMSWDSSLSPQTLTTLAKVQDILKEGLKNTIEPGEGVVMLTMMTTKCYDELTSASQSDSGWAMNCHCGHHFIATARQGKCTKCGMGFEILKSPEELRP